MPASQININTSTALSDFKVKNLIEPIFIQ